MKYFPAASSALFLVATAVASASPVEKVVTLLTDLKKRITADGDSEQLIYDKYACWCETTTSRKAANINKAKDEIRSLGQSILSLKSTEAVLAAEIADLLADIKANEEFQAQATAVRQTENAAYMAESAEMKQALAALEQAIIVLKDATGASLLQHGVRGSTTEAQRHLRAVLSVLPSSATLKPAQLALLRSATSARRANYAPQSATIQGILGDMYKTFTSDLEAETKKESTKNRDFEDLIAQKQQTLIEMQSAVQKKQAEKAETEVMLAESVQAYDDTESQMKADIEFFDATKAACSAKSNEWTVRSNMRTEELDGIAKALEILTSDEARELFGKAIKPGMATPTALLQMQAISTNAALPAKRNAYEAVKAHASSSHSLRLAKIAVAISAAKVGHFDEVIEAIDTMIATLKAEGTEDIAKRDQCIEEYKNINSTVADTTWKITVNEAKIQKMEALIEKKKTEKLETTAAIGQLETDIKNMKEQRTAENQAFLQAKQEDTDAISLLTEAKDVLSAYYVKHNVTMGPIQGFLQQGPVFEVSEDQAPDATFSNKAHRKGESKGIISILTMLIEDLGGEIQVLQRDEESAQLAFEEALHAAETLKIELEAKKISLETVIAETGDSKLAEGETKKDNQETVKTTEDYRTKIEPDCDFIIGSFESRADKRTAEMEGLVQAKEFLAGYQPPLEEPALAQRHSRGVSMRSHPGIVA